MNELDQLWQQAMTRQSNESNQQFQVLWANELIEMVVYLKRVGVTEAEW